MGVSGAEMGDQKMGINVDGFTKGEVMNMGIINQYGQLMGEFSRLDDELWLCKSDDNDGFVQSSGSFHWDLFSSNVDLKKLSHIVDDSYCNGGSAVAKGSSSSLVDSSLDQSQDSDPIPTPQSRRSYSNFRTSVTKRARSKRHRPSKCNSQLKKQNNSSPTKDYMDCPLLDEMTEPAIRTKKVEDLLQSRDSKPRKGNPNSALKPTPKRKLSKKAIKKCAHCESTRTPQWREGPLGRGTLCNACGVQFKHGRLFPEYRPLSSPHFDPSLHSNLPKKVQQMRMNKSW